jgi:MFS transporter, LPLT family, lysophospholipid transporter
VSALLLGVDIPLVDTGIDTPAEAAIALIVLFYLIAAAFNVYIPDTGARYSKQQTNPIKLITEFGHCFTTLWKDKLGQITLAVTTLFWGAGATLQFIVLRWADHHLHMPLSKAAVLQGVFALGIAGGAVLAARFIPLKRSLKVIPVGIVMGGVVMTMTLVTSMPIVYTLMIAIGMMAGFFVVPMNALLQHRGHVLLSAGHSIAVQNFNENLFILVMLALYALLLSNNWHINTIIILFGNFVLMTMFLVQYRHMQNKRKEDVEARIGEAKH